MFELFNTQILSGASSVFVCPPFLYLLFPSLRNRKQINMLSMCIQWSRFVWSFTTQVGGSFFSRGVAVFMEKLRRISEHVDLTDEFSTGNEGSSMVVVTWTRRTSLRLDSLKRWETMQSPFSLVSFREWNNHTMFRRVIQLRSQWIGLGCRWRRNPYNNSGRRVLGWNFGGLDKYLSVLSHYSFGPSQTCGSEFWKTGNRNGRWRRVCSEFG